MTFEVGHFYSFDANVGEQFSFDAVREQARTTADMALQVVDNSGNVLAEEVGGQIDWIATADGKYFLRI